MRDARAEDDGVGGELLSALLEDERQRAERRLAIARLLVVLASGGLTAVFTAFASGDDVLVQQRALAILAATAVYAASWLVFLRGRRHRPLHGVLSSNLDLLFVLLLLLNWSWYPSGLLPTQAKFAPGFGALLLLIVLTGLRFDSRAVLAVATQSAAGYAAYLAALAHFGGVRFVVETAGSFPADRLNVVDVGARLAILLMAGGVVAFLVHRGQRLLLRSVRATEQRQRLRQFVSANVVEEIESGRARMDLSGHRRRVTIMFCDIRDFTVLSEQLPPEELLELLNGYYEVVAEEVFRHQGTLDKYLGDGIMALFGAPRALENSSLSALRCAQAMLEGAKAYGAARGRELGVGVGLHTAEVVVGNLGTRTYKNYTAVGAGVNLAARIESATRGSGASVLFSAAVKEQLPAETAVKSKGQFTLKGVSAPVELFTLDEHESDAAPGQAGGSLEAGASARR